MALRLTPTSFIVMGLLRWAPDSTAYELERTIRATVQHMWSIQRSQIYREPARLAAGGFLESKERSGDRHGTGYSLTAEGERALDEWLGQVPEAMPQLRDPAILKLFFGAPERPLAEQRLGAHQARLKEYEVLRAAGGLVPPGPVRALDAAIAHERTAVRFWSKLASPSDDESIAPPDQ